MAGSTAVCVSHPFAALWSQSANPPAHATIEHVDAAHFSTALTVLHAAPQEPQLFVSLAVLTQEALFPEPQRVGVAAGQVCPHAGGVPPQDAEPLAGAGHSPQVAPQELVDVDESGTQVPLQA